MGGETAEQNPVILSQIWEGPQGIGCRAEAAVSGLRLVQSWVD